MRRDYEKWAKNPVATRASASRTLFQYQDQPHRDCIGALDALPEDSSQTYRITILHSDLKKEMVGMRMESNRMLTEMMLQMDTTKKALLQDDQAHGRPGQGDPRVATETPLI